MLIPSSSIFREISKTIVGGLIREYFVGLDLSQKKDSQPLGCESEMTG